MGNRGWKVLAVLGWGLVLAGVALSLKVAVDKKGWGDIDPGGLTIGVFGALLAAAGL